MVILDGFAQAADAGSAVVIADQVAKSAETRGRWARGSGAKMRRYNGACYEIVLGESYTPTKPGSVRLKVAKDRNGGVEAIGATAGRKYASNWRRWAGGQRKESLPVRFFAFGGRSGGVP